MVTVIETLKAQVAALEEIDARNRLDVDGMLSIPDPELLAIPALAQSIARTASGLVAAAAGEIARRSTVNDASSLARRNGARSAVAVVAKQAGVSVREAVQLVKVGEATRPEAAVSGEAVRAKHPHVAAALADGTLSVSLAELIQTTLGKVDQVLWADQADELEAKLVRMASSGDWSVLEFTRYCKQIPNHVDPAGAESREDALRALARITETRLPNGLLRVVADLHPELEGWWKTAMAAKTAPRRRGRLGIVNDGTADGGSGCLTAPDDRTQLDSNQVKLEALTTILRQAIQVDDGQAAGVDVTMLVTIGYDALVEKLGSVMLSGVDEPISAGTARRLAAQANIIPQILDGKSVVLDQGFSKRSFTKQQRYALATRDQGCTFPHCPLPPGMTEVNHIEKWRDTENTDLNNGALLCGFHNRLLERGWEMEFRDGIPWFTPPADIDPARTPIRGGRPRPDDLDLHAHADDEAA